MTSVRGLVNYEWNDKILSAIYWGGGGATDDKHFVALRQSGYVGTWHQVLPQEEILTISSQHSHVQTSNACIMQAASIEDPDSDWPSWYEGNVKQKKTLLFLSRLFLFFSCSCKSMN